MKTVSLNHMELVFTDSKHSLFHYLAVVIIKTLKFLIFLPVSAYLIAIGFSLAAKSITDFLPADLVLYFHYYSNQLPYFLTFKINLFNLLNSWGLKAPAWWAMVVGLPMIIISLIIFITNVANLFYAFFSFHYNLTHCPFCKQPIKARKKLKK